MTVLSRKVASIPVRSASETWLRIAELVAPAPGEARDELLSVVGVTASLIAREAMKDSPIVVIGKGPRLRVYCVHGAEAVEGTHVNEATLPASPVESPGWTTSLPCPQEDLVWVEAALQRVSDRITARDQEDRFMSASDQEATEEKAVIDLESFLRP